MIRSRGLFFLVLAAAFAFLALNMLFRGDTPPETAKKIHVLVAREDIPAGTPLSGFHVVGLPWNDGERPKGGFSDFHEIEGRVAASRILKGEPVTEKRLLPKGEHVRDEPSLRVEPGMRAMNLLLPRDLGMTDQIGAGDVVDVLVSHALSERDGTRVSRILVENVVVLETGESEAGADSEGKIRVTLTLRPEDAALLLSAEEERIRLVLRNPRDREAASPGEPTDATIFTRRHGPVSRKELSGIARRRFERLCSGIPEGMRAVSVGIIDDDGICGRLWPGCRVDLVATHEFVSTSALNQNEGVVTDVRKLSKIVMRNIEVLVMDTDISSSFPPPAKEAKKPDGDGEDRGKGESMTGNPDAVVHGVTLLVNPEDAEKLIVLAETSRIRLVLRREGDASMVDPLEREGASEADIFGVNEKTAVEIIRGTVKGGKIFDGAGDGRAAPGKRRPDDREI